MYIAIDLAPGIRKNCKYHLHSLLEYYVVLKKTSRWAPCANQTRIHMPSCLIHIPLFIYSLQSMDATNPTRILCFSAKKTSR